jgi:membrane protease YdiL (CAAX protease family)
MGRPQETSPVTIEVLSMDPDTPAGDPRDISLGESVAISDSGAEASNAAAAAQPVWGYWDLLYFVLFAVPAIFFVAIICVAGFMGLNLVFGWELGLDSARVQAPLVIVIQLFWWLLVFGYIYVVVTSKYDLPFGPSIGWKALQRPPAFYLLGGVALAFTVAGVSALIPKPETTLPMEALLRDEISIILMALFGVIVAPVAEEVVFRGFLYPVFERKHGVVTAVVLTSLPFSFLHGPQYGWQWQNLTLLLGVAIVFGIVRARTGSVISSTLIHVAYNATLFSVLFAAAEPLKKM